MKSTYPGWIGDGSPIPDPDGKGQTAVDFLRRLKHPKSRLPGRAFQLDPWQERIIRRIYGPRHPDGSRVVKTVALMLPRGNRKTSISAALALLHTFGPERVPAGEAIFAAANREQAGIGFREAVGIVRAHKAIARACRIYDAHNSAKKIVYRAEDSKLEVISKDGGSAHGRTPNFVLADELHIWPDRYLWEALTSGLDKTDDGLLVVASTAGRGQENVAHEFFEDARKVARGEVHDPSILPILFEAERGCDWRDEDLWHRVNPGLRHGYPSLEGFRRAAKRADRSAAERDTFLQLKLNVWQDASTSPFVDMLVYDEGAAPIDAKALDGRPCWIGVDLSKTNDLTAVVAAFRDADDGFTVLPFFFVPADRLQLRADRDGVPYPAWRDAGLLTATVGNVVDYGAVEACIRGLCERFDVQEIGFDPHFAHQVQAPLLADGFPVVDMRQGWVTQSPAIALLRGAIEGRKFRHGGHPILRWNFENIAVHRDLNENETFHKAKSTERIDGAVASWMAVSRAAAGNSDSWGAFADPNFDPKHFVI